MGGKGTDGPAFGGSHRALLAEVSDMVTVSDRAGAIVYANPATERVTGYAPEEFAALGPFSLMHPGDRARCEEAFGELAANPGLVLKLEHRFRRKDGEWRWAEGTFASRFDDPEVGGLVATVRDVTARKEAERALREGEERQAFLLRLSDALRPLGDPVEIEGEACRLLAERLEVGRAYYVEVDEAAGLARVERDFVRDGAPSLAGEHRTADFSWSVGILRRGEHYAIADTQSSPLVPPADRPASAALGIIACVGAPLVKAGRLVGALCVTDPRPRGWSEEEVGLLREAGERIWAAVERARAEAALGESNVRFRSIANLVPDLLWSTRPDGYTDLYNQRWTEYTGQTPEQASGWGWTDAIHPDDREGSARRYREAVESGRALAQEHRIRRHDGEYRWFLVRAEPVRDGTGGTTMFGSATDVHDQRMMIATARESAERQAFLLALGDAMRARSGADAMIEAAARLLVERLGASRVLFAEFDEERGIADVFQGWSADGAEPFPAVMRLADFDGPIMEDLRAGRTVRIDDAGDPPFGRPDLAAVAGLGVKALLSVPLVVGGGLAVNLSVHQHAARRWTDGEAALVREVAERLWADLERARAEAALAASEEKYRTLFDAIDEGLAIVEMVYDDRGEIVDMVFRQVNAAYERIGGVHDVVGRSVSEVLPGVEEIWLERYKQVAKTGLPLRVEDYQRDVGRWFDVYFSRVDEDGRFVATVFNDVTERKRAEAELRASEERQAFLLKLSDILQRQTAPDDMKTAAMHALGTHLGVGRAQYHEVDGSGEYYSADGIGYADGLPLLDLKYRIDQFGGFVAEDFEAGRPFRSDDLLADPRPTAEEREAYGSYRIRAGAGIPLLRGGKLVAILAVHDARPHPWTDLEMELIRETAERVWVAVEKVRTEVAMRESEGRQAFLLELGDRLRTEADPRAISLMSVTLLADHLRLDRAYVAQVDKARDLAEIGPEYRRADLAPVEGVLTLSDFPKAWSRVEEATLVLTDTAGDPTLSDSDKRGFAALRMGALMVASARKGTRNPVWAVLVASEEPRRWTAAEVALVEETAERTWAAVERARAEEALRESEERNRLIVEGARDYAIITTDPEGRIASWSAGAEAVLGWGAEEVLGRPTAITFVPEDREAGEPERELAVARREGSAPDVRWHLRKDGSRVFIEGTTRALRAGDGGGQLRGFLKVGQDVTERRRAEEALRASEERYRTLVENVGDHAVFLLDPGGYVTEWTGSAERVKGYPPEEAVGRHLSVFYAPEEREAGEPGRELAEAAEKGRAEREGWRVRKDGGRIWVNEIATAVRDGEGDLVGFAKIARDLTERRELEEERERARVRELTALAEAAERERISRELHDRVAHHMGVAHQSLELFSAMRGAAPERAEERLALARESTRAALDQTRALSAELKRLQEEELEDGLGAALRTLGALMSDGVAVDVSVSGDESAVPEPIALQVYLATREAVRNAVRHSGGSRVGVTLEVSDGEVRGLIEDDGRGFDPEAVGKASPSWGVGLRSMRERAEMLGGSTRLDSAPGAGTRVEVRVPLDGRRP